MSTTTLQGERKRINKVIRTTAWAMLVIGIVVTIAGFAIQAEYSAVHWNYHNDYHASGNCLLRTTVPETYEQYWCGFMVVFTTFILLADHDPWLKIQKHLPKICKKRAFAVTMILLSMLSGFAVMSQDGETFGRLRRYRHSDYGCYENRDLDKANMHHLTQILHWLYVILIASNILVVLCLVQLMAFLAMWILEMIVKIKNTEQQNSVQEQPSPPPYTAVEQSPSCSSEPQHDLIPLLASGPRHVPQQPYVTPRGCGCPYHAPQPPHCHHCSRALYPQENPSIVVPPQHDAEEECPQQQTASTQP